MSKQRLVQRLRGLVAASKAAEAALAPSETPTAVRSRVEKHRQARLDAGLTHLGLWAHPDDHQALRRIAKRKAAARGIEL
jgi:hypothetical protein